MHLGVHLVESGEITVSHQRLLHAQIAAQLDQLVFGDVARHQVHRRKLQRFAQEGAFANLLHRESGDESPGLRHHIHQTFGGQPRHRLGYRRAGHAKRLADLGLAQNLARAIGQRQDGGFQRQIDAVRQGSVKLFQRPQARQCGVCLLRRNVFTG